jgi:dGTPase
MNGREKLEFIEDKTLAPYATKSSQSLGRTLHGEEPDDYRGCFQRDRDRILYSKAFKDLQYKTQVFLISEGDFYRTRLTHTLEVAQHARTLARVFRLNEDLCEAIAYAHDLGHTPFGHAGEEALNEIMQDDGGFEHNLQSLKIVDSLEKRYQQYDGLNLCYETREGIALHSTTNDHPAYLKEFKDSKKPSLEAQVVNIADPLAYGAHDLEDALNAGYLSIDDVRKTDIPLVKKILKKCSRQYKAFDDLDTVLKSRILVRTLIEEANIMVINETVRKLELYQIDSAAKVRQIDIDIVSAAADDWCNFNAVKSYLFEHVYRKPQVCVLNEKGKLIIRRIFEHLETRPEMLPLPLRARFERVSTRTERRRVISDYIAGMTDRYAMDLYKMMFEPYEKVMFEFRY